MPRQLSPRSLKGPAVVVLGFVLLAPLAAAQTCNDCHDTEGFEATVHGFLDCADCHAGAAVFPHDEMAPKPDCALCHDTVVERYDESAHGRTRAGGASEAPDCASCHGPVHSITPSTDPASPVHPARLAETCGACHANPAVVERFGIPIARPLEAYSQSVHARALDDGGPTCSDCHGSHEVLGANDPRSKVFHQTVPRTCGGCHAETAEAYAESVHGAAAAHGAREAPVCTDCHGEHRILSPEEAGSPVFATNVPKMTCGRCHGDLRLAEKYGIPGDKVPAYRDSYHGLAARSGVVTVAHCGSCHGVHDILPSADPRSHTHRDNLPQTCGQCHPGAGTRFAIGTVHVVETERSNAAVFWVRRIYLWVIWVTVGAMVLHNALDLRRKVLSPPVRPAATPGGPERMSRGFRAAHGLLIGSFVVLVYTGFALTYPEAWWARPVLRWEEAWGLRGWLHRGAAIALLVALAIHLVHLAFDRKARRCIAGMRPRAGDWAEVRERLLWYVGQRPRPPVAPELGYPEKIEYVALMWGTAVMVITGFMLWSDDLLLRWAPKWVSDLATTIHFYEAVLASLAILVWHLYFVIFDPVVYPMDRAWLSGRSHPGRAAERRPAPDGPHGTSPAGARVPKTGRPRSSTRTPATPRRDSSPSSPT